MAFLRNSGLAGAAAPLENALHALLDGMATPSRYKDVIRDAYEAVEYAAKVLATNDRTLSANRDLLVTRGRLQATTAALLSEYIAFGNRYRHARSLAGLPEVDARRAEQFIYETALILRDAEPAVVESLGSGNE